MQVEQGKRAAMRAAKRDEGAARDAAKRARLAATAREAIAKYEVERLAARAACDSEAVAQASDEADAAYRDLARFEAALAAEARARGGRDGRARK